MRRIIKQGLVVALALGTLGSPAWASDKTSRWEGFCYAMQADVNAETIKQAPPPDVTPFQEAQPIAPMTQIFCGIRIVGSEIYCNAMIGLPTGYTGILRVQLQNSKDGENWETQHTWLCSDSTVSYMDRIAGLDLQYRVRVVADVSNAAGEKVKQIEKVSSCVWG